VRFDVTEAAFFVAVVVPPVAPANAVKTTVLPPVIVCDDGWLLNVDGLPVLLVFTASVTGMLETVPAVFETVTV
jgi:hypothetical protein